MWRNRVYRSRLNRMRGCVAHATRGLKLIIFISVFFDFTIERPSETIQTAISISAAQRLRRVGAGFVVGHGAGEYFLIKQ